MAGPAGLSVADAEVEENVDETIEFTVSLDRAASKTVTVDYATSDGRATAGADYTAVGGTSTFASGERTKTVEVTLLDDTHDEGEETFTLRLSNASGAVITASDASRVDREPRPDAAGAGGALRAGGGARGRAPRGNARRRPAQGGHRPAYMGRTGAPHTRRDPTDGRGGAARPQNPRTRDDMEPTDGTATKHPPLQAETKGSYCL